MDDQKRTDQMVERKLMSYSGILTSGLAVYLSRPLYFSAHNRSPSFPSTMKGRPVRRSCIAHYLRSSGVWDAISPGTWKSL